MRELLITITILSLVSSEEFEPKKRLGIPPEDDPNFWPTRGRRSYWSDPRLIANFIHRDVPQGPEIDYGSRGRSWSTEKEFLSIPEVLDIWDNRRFNTCPKKKPISLLLPYRNYHQIDSEIFGCGERCDNEIRGRGRRGDERWRRQQPLYAEEPGWIAIKYDNGVLGSSRDEDPFIVTRGKKRSDDIFEVRERRQLEDVLRTHDTDPFFVARGKRDVDYYEDFDKNEKESLDFENNIDTEMRRKRRIQSEDKVNVVVKKSGDMENTKVFIDNKNRKNFQDDKKVFLTNPEGVKKDGKYRHARSERSPSSSSSTSSSSSSFSSTSEGFENDENKWIRNSEVPRMLSHDNSVLKSRYSRPRDKHSNLQGILDEPFFVSRGKKNAMDDSDGADIVEVEYLRYNDNNKGDEEESSIITNGKYKIPEGNNNLYPASSQKAFRDTDEEQNLLRKILGDEFKRFKIQYTKPLRNRRGMLDELLKSDDPFYVARGKRLNYYQQPYDSKYFDVTINDPQMNMKNGKYSLLGKASSRKKILNQLSDFSKIIQKPSPHPSDPYTFGERDIWNLTRNEI